MRKLLIGVVVSIVAILLIIYKVDLSAFNGLQERLNYPYLIVFFVVNTIALNLFAYRWYLLLQKKVSFRQSVCMVAIGHGLNMVLPARGGDFYRVFLSRQNMQEKTAQILSKLFIEKVIDLLAVVLLGLVAFFVLNLLGEVNSHKQFYILLVAVVFLIVVFVLLMRFAYSYLDQLLLSLFQRIKLEKIYMNQFQPLLTELHYFLDFKKINPILVLTFVMWVMGYSFSSISLQKFIGIELGFLKTLFLAFCGALSMALPAVPSAAGTFHAGIIAGFILLGLPQSEGLLFATTTHLVGFFYALLVALLGYFAIKFIKKNEFNSIN